MSRNFLQRHVAFIITLPLVLGSSALLLSSPSYASTPPSKIQVQLSTPPGDSPGQPVSAGLASGDTATANLSDTTLYAGQVSSVGLSITSSSTLASSDKFTVTAPSGMTLSPQEPLISTIGNLSTTPSGVPSGEKVAIESHNSMSGTITTAQNTSSGTTVSLSGNTADNMVTSAWGFTAPSTPGKYHFTANFGSGNTQTMTLTVVAPPKTYSKNGTTYDYQGVASPGSFSNTVLGIGTIILPTSDSSALSDFNGYVTGTGAFSSPSGSQPLTTQTVTATYTPSGATTATTTPLIADNMFQPYNVSAGSSASLNEAILANSAGQTILNSASSNPAVQAYVAQPGVSFGMTMGNATNANQTEYTYVLPSSPTTTSTSTSTSTTSSPSPTPVTQTVTQTVTKTVPGPTQTVTQTGPTQTQTQTQTNTLTDTKTLPAQTQTQTFYDTTTLPAKTLYDTQTVTGPTLYDTATVTTPGPTNYDTVTTTDWHTSTTTKTLRQKIHGYGQASQGQPPTNGGTNASGTTAHTSTHTAHGLAWWWLVVEGVVFTALYALIYWLKNRHE